MRVHDSVKQRKQASLHWTRPFEEMVQRSLLLRERNELGTLSSGKSSNIAKLISVAQLGAYIITKSSN